MLWNGLETAVMKCAELENGRTIRDVLPREVMNKLRFTLRKLEQTAERYGTKQELLRFLSGWHRMKPLFLSLKMGFVEGNSLRYLGPTMDDAMAMRAMAMGKPVESAEKPQEQCDFHDDPSLTDDIVGYMNLFIPNAVICVVRLTDDQCSQRYTE